MAGSPLKSAEFLCTCANPSFIKEASEKFGSQASELQSMHVEPEERRMGFAIPMAKKAWQSKPNASNGEVWGIRCPRRITSHQYGLRMEWNKVLNHRLLRLIERKPSIFLSIALSEETLSTLPDLFKAGLMICRIEAPPPFYDEEVRIAEVKNAVQEREYRCVISN